MSKDILLCGVGGQGTVLASKLIASAEMSKGHKVRSAETIGMAQRGGSVTSHVRVGEDAYSPLIPLGKADMIIAFEPAEAVRSLPYLKKDGTVIVNISPVRPITETLKNTGYDGTEMIEYLKQKVSNLKLVDGEILTQKCGSAKALNIILLGAATAAGELDITPEDVRKEIIENIPQKFHDMNLKAFEEGLRV